MKVRQKGIFVISDLRLRSFNNNVSIVGFRFVFVSQCTLHIRSPIIRKIASYKVMGHMNIVIVLTQKAVSHS